MNANKNTWSVDRIESDEWGSVNCQAVVWASNWAHDEMDFCIIWHPDDYPVHYDVTRRFVSKELQPFDADKIILNELLDSAVEQLDDWWSEVEALKKDLSVDKWKVPKGLAAPEILYAKCAVLYSLRSEFCPLRVVKLMAKDMSVPETTVKERLRKAKDKGFLTNPGKGLNGQGESNSSSNQTNQEGGKMKISEIQLRLPIYVLALAIGFLGFTQLIDGNAQPKANSQESNQIDKKALGEVLIEFANQDADLKNQIANLDQQIQELKSCLAAQQLQGARVVC